jgi:hypothetical protein
MSAPRYAVVNQPDNPASPKANHRARTELCTYGVLAVEYFRLHVGDEAQAEEAVRALERKCEVLKQVFSAYQMAAPPAVSN